MTPAERFPITIGSAKAASRHSGKRKPFGKLNTACPTCSTANRDEYAGRHTLVVGAGYSAATTATALAEVAREVPNTRITWVTRSARAEVIPPVPDDRLPERARLTQTANALATGDEAFLSFLPETRVRSVHLRDGPERFEVELCGRRNETLQVDHVVAQVGYRPDNASSGNCSSTSVMPAKGR